MQLDEILKTLATKRNRLTSRRQQLAEKIAEIDQELADVEVALRQVEGLAGEEGNTRSASSVPETIIQVLKESPKGLSIDELFEKVKGAGLDVKRNSVQVAASRLKKQERLRHEGRKYFPLKPKG